MIKLISVAEEKLERALRRARSQKWGDKADKYEKNCLRRKRIKMRKDGR